ncbi:hypothetical protein V7S43_009793 [Phytophthora oleae]|uniref:BZIP domain-containing protein n=1 Tax=Phytophthora oleae TaxID=2107226 RepID=A0ABD3FJK8_9STRA
MPANTLIPPNLHTLSTNVIADVVQRSQAPVRADRINYVTPQSATTQFFSDDHRTPNPLSDRTTTAAGRRPSPPLLPAGKLPYADEMKENIAAYHRERRRRNQERYRAKQRQSMAAVEILNHEMEAEIRQLQRKRDILSASTGSLATRHTVWSVAVEYFHVFRHGLPATGSVRTIGLDFLKATMSAELDAGTVQGLEALARNWTVFTHFFTDVQIQLGRLEQIAENSLVATTTTIITITSSSLSNIFPHLTNYGVDLGKANDWSRIAAKLLNQRLVMRGSVHFSWDSADSRVLRLITQADMVTPLLRVLGNLEDVSRVFNCARINPDGNIVVPDVWTNDMVGTNAE